MTCHDITTSDHRSKANTVVSMIMIIIKRYCSLEADKEVRSQMTSSWTNFALTGDPTPPGSDFSWLPVSEKIQEETQQWFFNFAGEDSAMDSSSEIFTRLTFWDNIMENSDILDENPYPDPFKCLYQNYYLKGISFEYHISTGGWGFYF